MYRPHPQWYPRSRPSKVLGVIQHRVVVRGGICGDYLISRRGGIRGLRLIGRQGWQGGLLGGNFRVQIGIDDGIPVQFNRELSSRAVTSVGRSAAFADMMIAAPTLTAPNNVRASTVPKGWARTRD